jgi:hypothetical protein
VASVPVSPVYRIDDIEVDLRDRWCSGGGTVELTVMLSLWQMAAHPASVARAADAHSSFFSIGPAGSIASD